jgi:hypothetical protein
MCRKSAALLLPAASTKRASTIDVHRLTNLFAGRFLGLRPTRDRFVKPDGSWIPRWRFAPLSRLEDAFSLLEAGGKRVQGIKGGRRHVLCGNPSQRSGWHSCWRPHGENDFISRRECYRSCESGMNPRGYRAIRARGRGRQLRQAGRRFLEERGMLRWR